MTPSSRALSLAAGCLMLLGSALSASAHPDIAVTTRVLFDIREGRLIAVAESLAFDEKYSARLFARFDHDGDGIFDGGEADEMRQALTEDLGATHFLTELAFGGELLEMGEPDAFHASVATGSVSVTFGFRLEAPVAIGEGQILTLMQRDRDYTVAFRLAEDRPVLIRGGEGHCAYSVVERPDLAYFGGLVVPQAITLTCR
ncbi:DUF1007 family protein [Rhizobium cremeum]|uniref:DUF1007 family protein n=1 Tax=Rhizobium cremeum TaxID=2813827 RepID=UPI001FD333F8|nr:DUF1007 family protein [Rhizobium cremeum]MCJ7997458.1 DUF1007 family protein [Rhizobium cremeum]MCJ8002552.1 DUF1007 family protein [Rhizobium cremeum]